MTKTRKRLLVASLSGLSLVAVVLIGMLLIRERPGVTAANIAAIRVGMTYTEVETLMGCPSGSLPSDPTNVVTYRNLPEAFVIAPYGRPGAGHDWIGRNAAAFVIFDSAGQVEEVIPYAVGPIKRKAWWQVW
jgi:hypothetical protein